MAMRGCRQSAQPRYFSAATPRADICAAAASSRRHLTARPPSWRRRERYCATPPTRETTSPPRQRSIDDVAEASATPYGQPQGSPSCQKVGAAVDTELLRARVGQYRPPQRRWRRTASGHGRRRGFSPDKHVALDGAGPPPCLILGTAAPEIAPEFTTPPGARMATFTSSAARCRRYPPRHRRRRRGGRARAADGAMADGHRGAEERVIQDAGGSILPMRCEAAQDAGGDARCALHAHRPQLAIESPAVVGKVASPKTCLASITAANAARPRRTGRNRGSWPRPSASRDIAGVRHQLAAVRGAGSPLPL